MLGRPWRHSPVGETRIRYRPLPGSMCPGPASQLQGFADVVNLHQPLVVDTVNGGRIREGTQRSLVLVIHEAHGRCPGGETAALPKVYPQDTCLSV
jgi:hypothetical protein